MDNGSRESLSPVQELSPPPIPRSYSLNALDLDLSRRHSGYYALDVILEQEKQAVLGFEAKRQSVPVGYLESLLDFDLDAAEEIEDTMENDENYGSTRRRRDSSIPPVPRIPSIYARESAQNAAQGRGRDRPARRPSNPPVSYNRQNASRGAPIDPESLRSPPTVARSNLTASVSSADLSRPAQRTLGSLFPKVDGRTTTSTRIVSNPSTLPNRQLMPSSSRLQAGQMAMRPAPAMTSNRPLNQGNSSFGAPASSTRGNARTEDARRASPKHQRSLFGRLKASAATSTSGQTSDTQDVIRSRASLFSLRKTPSRIMNLDQVARGATPLAYSAPTDQLRTAEPRTSAHEDDPAPKRQRSRFDMRKVTPTRIPTPVWRKRQANYGDQDSSTSVDDSMLSKDVGSSISADESMISRDTETSKDPLNPSPRPYRSSFFNVRKTPTGYPKSSMAASPETPIPLRARNQPSPRQHHSFMNLQPTSPTRIPTPVAGNSGRNFSTPILPSQKKENIHPRTHRLLGPISPSRTQAVPQKRVPKARTLGMLSNLSSTFSRSNTNLTNPSNSSAASLRTAEPTTSVSHASASAPQPNSAPSSQFINEAQHSSYWCGRFQSLHDRFHNEMLGDALKDPEVYRSFQDNSKFPAPKVQDNDPKKIEDQEMYEPATTGIQHIRNDEDRRVLRVFAHLRSLCVTEEARQSLWEFQQLYARSNSNEKWLPTGGSMEDKPPGWVSRMTNVIGRRSEKGGNSGSTAMGRRTGLNASVFGRKTRANTQAMNTN